jgi:dUTP pyrophosphatase
MAEFNSTDKTEKIEIIDKLLYIYPQVMHLKIFVLDYELKKMYLSACENHNSKLNNPDIDAGVDLFIPTNDSNSDEEYILFYGIGWDKISPVNKVDFKIKCSATMHTENGKVYNTGYYIHPRSSLSKTNLRLANATGIIDSGYRGNIIGMFDVQNIDTHDDDSEIECDFYVKKFDRLLQICAPSLVPIVIEIVDTFEELGQETLRGNGGFGSTGR